MAKERGFDALAVTDRNGLYGAIQFYKLAKEAGVKPIIGVSLDEPLTTGDGGGRTSGKRAEEPTQPLTLLAKNRLGYAELCHLATRRQLNENFALAGITPEETADCILLTADPALLRTLHPRFPPEQLFAAILPPLDKDSARAAREMLALAAELHRKPVAVNDVHFISPADWNIHRLLRAIGENETIYTVKDTVPNSRYLLNAKEMRRAFRELPDALATTREIADACEVEFELGRWVFPEFALPAGMTPARRLRELCIAGLSRRYEKLTSKILRRLDYELGVISRLGYATYILAVHDIVAEANRRGIPNLGRGSAANSLVCYALFLTHVDPLAYNLYFERFLNPERTSPPDIDIDFNWKRRDEVIHYVYEKYGDHRVAMISTHVTFQARSALRETAKALGFLDGELERVLKRLPFYAGSDVLVDFAERYPETRGIDLSAPEYRALIAQAMKLGGLPRHLGIHVGGIVIAPDDICNYTALARSAKGFVVTQYDMFPIEDVGLIKIDLLGNRSLGVLEDTLATLRERDIQPPVNDFAAITRDAETVRLIREGRTMGCFYIESPGMRQLLRKLGTQTFEELTAASSVIRPGVAESGMMQEFIKRHRDPSAATYLHPKLKKILAETYGVMVYQEDVIRVAHELAGMTLAEADLLRRAMSGKLRSSEAMAGVREKFLRACARNGLSQSAAAELWRQIRSFAGYAFCKAHSAAFAVLSFQVAYLKAHHPAEFMAAVMSNHGGFYSTSAYIQECRRLGLRILLPDVNASELDFTAAENGSAIRVGLSQIGEVRTSTIESILAARKRGGRFTSLADLIRRTDARLSDLTVLIRVGALDSLGFTRPQLMALLRSEFAPNHTQGDFLPLADEAQFRALAESLPNLADYDRVVRCYHEMKYLGFGVTDHPLAFIAASGGDVVSAKDLPQHVGETVRIIGWCIAQKRVDIARRQASREAGKRAAMDMASARNDGEGEGDDSRQSAAEELGIIASGERKFIPAGRAMKFMSMEDLTGTYEAVLFPKAYERLAPLTVTAGPFLLTGCVENHQGGIAVNVRNLSSIPPQSAESG